MNLGHHGAPQLLGQVFLVSGELYVVVEAGPGCGRIIRRISGKPYIIVIRGRTGLAGDRHAAEIYGAAGAAGDNVNHGVCQKESGSLLDDLS